MLSLLLSAVARADERRLVERIEISGIRRTREGTLLELLPRQPPAYYSEADLRELARRVANLAVFDRVDVERDGATVRIVVREKWTLVPQFDFATGTTPADTYALLGVTEYNFLGTANALSMNVYREQRGFGFYIDYTEHVYRRHRWTWGAEASYGRVAMRFRGGEGWYTTNAIGMVWTTSPPIFSDHLRYELGFLYTRQTIHDVEGDVRPPDGHILGLSMMFTWDAYEWHDLTPRGIVVNLSATPAAFFGPALPQNRYRADLEIRAAARLWPYAVLAVRASAGVAARGNPSHSLWIGSLEGVRGLEDALYFNWAQAYTNLELRQAIPLAARWALQAVAFMDSAIFEQVDVHGRRDEARVALNGGGGARLVPTWISGLVLRFDVARLVLPARSMFYQFGVSQYF
jgi:hypothetical protein